MRLSSASLTVTEIENTIRTSLFLPRDFQPC